MKIEVLYPDLALEFGDRANVEILMRLFPEAERLDTSLHEKPHFLDEPVALVYLGSSEEAHQASILEALRPYAKEIGEAIRRNQFFLLTGNAFDIFGEWLEEPDASRIAGLGLYPFVVRRNYALRRHGTSIGRTREGIEVAGVLGRYSDIEWQEERTPFVTVLRETGKNPRTGCDGFRDGRLIATSYNGAFLSMNWDLLSFFSEQFGQKMPEDPLFDRIRQNQEYVHACFLDERVQCVFEG
ncbi:MAG: hypothetical protein SOR89_05920 [Ndongobacter sp.]|nr:hypothetical protein [Ndongobacter sp.]